MKALILPVFTSLFAATILGCGAELALLLLQTIAGSDLGANTIFLCGALTTFFSFIMLTTIHLSDVKPRGF